MFDNGEDSLIIKDQPLVEIKRSWFSRAFGKMEKDSQRKTIIVFLVTSTGTGTYSIFHILHGIGIVWGLLLILTCCIFSTIAFNIYCHASIANDNPEKLSTIITKAVNSWFNVIVNIITGFYLYLILIAFCVGTSKLFYLVFEAKIWDMFVVDIEKRNFASFNSVFSYLICFCSFFLVVQKNIDKLSNFSTLAFIVTFYLLVLILIQTPAYFAELKLKGLNEFNFLNCTLKDALYYFGLGACTFNNVFCFLLVRNNVKNPTKKRLKKVSVRTNGLIYMLYLVCGLTSYLTLGITGAETTDLIIFREKIGETDNLMVIGQFLCALAIFVAFCLIAFSFKMIIMEIFADKSALKNLVVTVLMMLSIAYISSVNDNVTDYLTLTGAFAGTCSIIIFPSIIALNTGYAKSFKGKVALVVWLTFGVVMCIVSTYMSIIKFIHGHY